MWFAKKQKFKNVELQPNSEIIDYILKSRKAGASDDLIRENLKSVGWQESFIDGSFLSLNTPLGPAPRVEIVEMEAQEETSGTSWLSKLITAFLVFILIVTGLAVTVIKFGVIDGKTFLGYSISDLIFARYMQEASIGPASGKATLKYEDGSSFEFTLGDKQVVLKDLGGMLAWEGGHDFSDSKKVVANGDFKLTGVNNGENYEVELAYKLVENKIFTVWKPGQSAQAFFDRFGIRPNVWYELATAKSESKPPGEKSGNAGKNDYRKLIEIKKLLGSEWRDNTLYLHYDLKLNPDKAKLALLDMVLNLPNYNILKGKYVESASLVSSVNSIVDNLNIENLEVWVNARNFKLTRIVLKSNAPSLVSIIGQSLKLSLEENSKLSTPVGQRLKDVRDIQAVLDKFKGNNGGFPSSGKTGVPDNLIPEFLGVWPTEPGPSEKCSDFYNSYWYTAEGTAYLSKDKNVWVYPKYSLTFCLPEKLGKFEEGIGIATQDKLITTTACQNGRPDCYKTESKVGGEAAENYFSGIPFSASLNFEHEFTNFNKLTPPEFPENPQKLGQ